MRLFYFTYFYLENMFKRLGILPYMKLHGIIFVGICLSWETMKLKKSTFNTSTFFVLLLKTALQVTVLVYFECLIWP